MKLVCPICGEKVEIPESEDLTDKMRIYLKCSKNHLIFLKIVMFGKEMATERKPFNKWLTPIEDV